MKLRRRVNSFCNLALCCTNLCIHRQRKTSCPNQWLPTLFVRRINVCFHLKKKQLNGSIFIFKFYNILTIISVKILVLNLSQIMIIYKMYLNFKKFSYFYNYSIFLKKSQEDGQNFITLKYENCIYLIMLCKLYHPIRI